MTFKKLIPMALSACLLASASVCSLAQSAVDGAIGGNVEDKSGAVVPNAAVTIHSNDTNAEQKVTADGSGFFRVIHLAPGAYTVTVEAPGFEKFNATGVSVTVGELTDPHARLTLGASSETIEVTSDAPAINTTSNDFANVVDQKTLQDLPVNNYRWSAYALLTPGVVESGGFGLLSFRGQSTLLNNVTFDGADDNQAYFSEERGRTRAGYSTAKASIQEFQVNTSNYSVEYGRSAGGVVNAVTKSGGNKFHGDAYFYDRDAGWGAKNRFTTHSVQSGLTASGAPNYITTIFQPKDVRKQYGFAFGGPIWKDKIFFFIAGDRYNRVFPGISAPTSPSIFYTLPDLTLPASAAPCATANLPAATATQDAAACQLAANLYTTTKSTAGITNAQYATAASLWATDLNALNTVTGTNNRIGNQLILFPRFDFQINGKNHATVEANLLRWTSPAGIQTSTSALNYGTQSFGDDYVKDSFVIGKLDSQITTHFANEVRYQYGRDFEYEYNQTPTPYEKSTLLNPTGYTNPTGIPPFVAITNALQIGTATFLNRASYPDERRWQLSDTANYVWGKHSLKFGEDYIHTNDYISNNPASGGAFGNYSYGGSNYAPLVEYFSDLNANNSCATGAVARECWTAYAQAFGPLLWEFKTGDYALFAQDEWKVSPRLSLTLGVRWEYEQLPPPQIPAPTTTDTSVALHGSTSIFPSRKTNVGPRVGFAYDMFGDGETVLRGGVGEFFARVTNSNIFNALVQTGNPGGQLSQSFTSSTQIVSSQTSGVNISAPIFPRVLAANVLPALNSLSSVTYFDSNFKVPEILQADLTLEQDLGFNTTISVTWLGAYGRRLPNTVDTNLPTATSTIAYTVYDPSNLGPIPNGTIVTSPFYSGTRPDATRGAENAIFSGLTSNYEAAVFSVKHRFSHGFQFSGNYTWSHTLDYGTSGTSLLDPKNLKAEYGNGSTNVPNRIVLNMIYETPSKFHGVLGYLLNQYEISPSFQYQNGNGYSLGVSATTNGLVSTTGAALTAFASSINGSGGANRVPGVDRNLLNLPDTHITDLRLSKRFKVKEYGTIELLGEAFNVENHFNTTALNTTAYGSSAGTAANVGVGKNVLTYNSPFGTATSGNSNFIYTPRQVQLGVRMHF